MKPEDHLRAAWRALDRSQFLDGPLQSMAAVDAPLPIGWGQTISQPSLVLEMTRLLAVRSDSKVLEVGTGSGFQTALLSRLGGQIYTLERLPELAARAKERLERLGYENISYRVGDGGEGWPEQAPFDRIMVTAGCAVLPDPLVRQLAPRGRMIIPVGPRHDQDLLLVTRSATGVVHSESHMKVVFVELVGPYGWSGDQG